VTNNNLLYNLIFKDVVSANSSVTRMSSLDPGYHPASSDNTTTSTVVLLCLGQSSVNSATTNSSSKLTPAENLTIDFAGAGHDEDGEGKEVEEDDISEEEHSQNLLSPRKSTTESSSMHTDSSTMHDSTASTAATESTTNLVGEVYTEPADYEDEVDPIVEILRGVIEDEAMYDKYQAAQIMYRTMKTAMVEENKEVSVGKGVKKTTWNVVDDINESNLPDLIPYYKQDGIKGFDFSEKIRQAKELE